MSGYKIVYRGGEGEIVEKKSRFIATVCPVNSEEDAAAFIEQTKRNTGMPDITVMPLSSGERNELSRCSDDGEPAGTAESRCWMCF